MNTNLIKAIIALSGYSDAEVAASMNLSKSSYYKRMRGEVEFKRAEINAADELLNTAVVRDGLNALKGINSIRDAFFYDESCLKATGDGDGN